MTIEELKAQLDKLSPVKLQFVSKVMDSLSNAPETTIRNSVFLIFSSVILCMATNPAMSSEEAVITPDELENYQFQQEPVEDNYVVNELGIGQRYTLDTWRKEAMNLIARHVGSRSLQGNTADLAVIQQIIDREILSEDQIREWQYLGVVFGDILVSEFDLTWVSYEDDLGVSKALRWRNSDNYVFPVTLFSKRIRFNEKPDAHKIYDKLATEINRFKLLPSPPVAPAERSR